MAIHFDGGLLYVDFFLQNNEWYLNEITKNTPLVAVYQLHLYGPQYITIGCNITYFINSLISKKKYEALHVNNFVV